MPYIHFTDEQKHRAGSVDLEEFLRRQGETLLPSGREKRLKADHSVTVRGSEWYDHAAQRGGGPVSFVQRFYGLSYPEAMICLLDGERGAACAPSPQSKEPPKEFALPPASQDMRRVYAYLMKQRFISRDVISHFAKAGLLYEDAKYHNAVFVGLDEHGVARHAHKRSTNSLGKSFRANVEGSDARYSFHHAGTGDRLYVFEAPIDLLSFLTLYPRGWREHSYVALCGTSAHAMLWMLEHDPNLRRVALCLDHDEAGIQASARLAEALHGRGYAQVGALLPEHKDWNEDLKALHGQRAQPAEDLRQRQITSPTISPTIELR